MSDTINVSNEPAAAPEAASAPEAAASKTPFKDPGFPGRGRKTKWSGPLVDYKEIELLRRFMSTSSKLASRKRGGTNAQEQKALKTAIKRARFLALLPYRGA